MPRSAQGTKKASATGIAKSAAGQAKATAASSKAKKVKKVRKGGTRKAGGTPTSKY